MRKEIKERILLQSNQALIEAKAVTSAPYPLSLKEITEHVHRYVCCKFYLDAESSRQMSLFQMAKASIEKALQMQLPLVKEGEVATTCGAAASEAMKVALLLTALQKDFRVSLDASKLGFAKNTCEVGKIVWEAYVCQLAI